MAVYFKYPYFVETFDDGSHKHTLEVTRRIASILTDNTTRHLSGEPKDYSGFPRGGCHSTTLGELTPDS